MVRTSNSCRNATVRIAATIMIISMAVSGVVSAAPAEQPVSDETMSYTVFAVGDIGLDQLPRPNVNRYQYDKVAALILENDPDAFLMLGDGQHNNGELQDYLDFYDTAFHPLGPVTYPVTGNHDYYVYDDAEGYFDYFGDPENCANSNLVLENDFPDGTHLGYYSFDIGTWHIVALNSHLSHLDFLEGQIDPMEGTPSYQQWKWLEADLASHSEGYTGTIATMHHPLFDWELYYRCEWISWFDLSTQIHLWNVFEEFDVDMVLSGHNHNYQCWAPQTPDGVYDPDGIRQFVVGTGGAYLSGLPTSTTSLDCAGDYPNGIPLSTLENLECAEDEYFGALKLTLDDTGCEYAFISVDGEVIDEGSIICD